MITGVFGGTFNPPHLGHLIVAEHAREQLGLGRVLFVPSAVSPHKRNLEVVDGRHRLRMLKAAVEGNRYFCVSDLEIIRGGISFTVDTLEALYNASPGDQLFLLIGADNVDEFHTWKDPERILELAEVVALTRPGFTVQPAKDRFRRQITVCRVPAIDIQANQVRRRVREGKSIRYLVPPAVEDYISKHRLYR